MKRGVLLFFIFLASSVYAETAYEGWIYSNDNLVLGDDAYKVLISDDNLLLMKDGKSERIELSQCSELDFKKFCYNITTFDKDEQTHKAYIEVIYLAPEIVVQRDLDNNILSVGEKATFSVSLRNVGNSDALSVNYIDILPSNADIVDTDNVDHHKSTINWTGEILVDEIVSFAYKIESIGKIDNYIQAAATYFDGYEVQTAKSDQIRLFSTPVLEIEIKTDKENYQIGEEIILTVSVNNKVDRNIEVRDFLINFPDSFDKNTISSDFDIDAQESKNFNYEITATSPGLVFVTSDGKFRYDNKYYDFDTTHGILIDNMGVELSSSLDRISHLNSQEIHPLVVSLKNQNSFSEIKNIRIIPISKYFNIASSQYSNIDINETVVVLNQDLWTPNVSSPITESILFNISYQSEDGKWFMDSMSKKVTIKPFMNLILLSNINNVDIFEDESLTVEVTLSNPYPKNLNDVSVKVTSPNILTTTEDKKTGSSIKAGESIETLSTEFISTKVQKTQAFDINLSANYIYENREYDVRDSLSFMVRPRPPIVILTRSINEVSYQGETIDVKYLIKSLDKDIFNLKLYPTEGSNIDIINYEIWEQDKLSVGEELEINTEKIRPKKHGEIKLQETKLEFKDNEGRQFTIYSDPLKLNLKRAEITGPAVIINAYPTKSGVRPRTDAIIIYNLTNIGLENVKGQFLGQDIEVQIYKESIIRKNHTMTNYGEFLLNESKFEYFEGDTKYTTFSNEVKIIVTNNPQLHDETEPIQPIIKKKNIFQRIIGWFIELFTKDNKK